MQVAIIGSGPVERVAGGGPGESGHHVTGSGQDRIAGSPRGGMPIAMAGPVAHGAAAPGR